MADYFPEEVLGDILARLPIQDLVRCISVCKFWYSLITGPNFISFHSKRIASTKQSLILVRDHIEESDEEHYSLHLDDEPFEEIKSLDFPLSSCFYDSPFRVIGCINGVVCLYDDIDTYTDILVLWNPTIGKFVALPDPIFGIRDWGFMLSVGFGFNAASNDFKVVRVVYFYEEEDRRDMDVTVPKVEVYEPRVGSWRSVDAKGFSYVIDECSPQAFLHGTVHWVMGSKNQLNTRTNLIVTFDLASEEFGVMKVPEILAENPLRRDFSLSVLGESLALIHDTWSDDGNVCSVWVLKQYGVPDSWTKQFSVDVTGGYWRVCGFRRNGDALVKADSQHPLHPQELLVSFELKSKQVKYFRAFRNWTCFYVDNFVVSLELLGVKGESWAKSKSSDTARAISKISPDDEVPWWLEAADRYFETADLTISENLTQFLGQFKVHLFYDTPCLMQPTTVLSPD